MTDTLEIKESAAQEKRQWVRLTKLCNNRCTFCLDTDAQDGTVVPFEDVKRRILAGVEEGATRLILSGGEPTIHPDFLAFVGLGRQAGYRWIQTVTNGRMFSYGRFAAGAVAAGLDEATFSMHGHTPALHDLLTGVPGAFVQALAGLKNLLGQCVVNVDVVLNRQNVPLLREILEFYMDLGIHNSTSSTPSLSAWPGERIEISSSTIPPSTLTTFAARSTCGGGKGSTCGPTASPSATSRVRRTWSRTLRRSTTRSGAVEITSSIG